MSLVEISGSGDEDLGPKFATEEGEVSAGSVYPAETSISSVRWTFIGPEGGLNSFA